MPQFPKIKPVRSKKYLAFIRDHLCAKCGAVHEIEAAHQNIGSGKMGGKVSDLQAIPLCRTCHTHPCALDDDLIARLIVSYLSEFFALGNQLEKQKR